MSESSRCCRKRFFGGNKQNFLRLLMRFVRSDVRDHIASQKNDHGPSYRHYRASQRRGSPKFTICEIFGVVRFSTFSTASVKTGSLSSRSITLSARLSNGGRDNKTDGLRGLQNDPSHWSASGAPSVYRSKLSVLTASGFHFSPMPGRSGICA